MTTESSSFLSNTLKRRQQKRQEVAKVLQEGISSLHLSSPPSEQQSQNNEGIYPLFNIDPESYVLDEGDERSMLEPHSSHNPDFKQMINVLFTWINSSLSKDSIIVRSFEEDFYDGYILGKLIEFHQPNIRLLYDEMPLSEELRKKTLRRVLNYVETCSNQPIKWSFEQIYNRNTIAIIHLLLTLMKILNIPTQYDLPKKLVLKVIVVKKINGLLQTKMINEYFIDDHEREITSISTTTTKQGDLIDALFDLAPEKLAIVEKTLVNFVNHHQIQINQIDLEEFQDGLYLLYLISHLENYFLIMNKYHHKKPITREQSYTNLQLVFQLMNEAGMQMEQYCRINDLLAGDERTLYRLLFQLYLRYNSDSNNLLQSITYLQPIRGDADSPFL